MKLISPTHFLSLNYLYHSRRICVHVFVCQGNRLYLSLFDCLYWILVLQFLMGFCFVISLVITVFAASLNCPFVIAHLVSLTYITFSITTLFARVVCEGSHLENTLHYSNTSVRGKAWAHKTKLTATLSTTVPVPNYWEIERSCICVYTWITICASFYDFQLHSGTVACSCFILYHHQIDCLYITDHTPNSYLMLTIICYHSYEKL